MFIRRRTPPSPAADTGARDADVIGAVDVPTMLAREQAWWLCFVAAHAALGLWIRTESIAVWVHGVLSVAIGLWWALRAGNYDRVAYVAAYITGSEVLWRMVSDALPWEFAKFSLILLSTTALVSNFGLKSLVAPALGFSLLLPSVALTVEEADPEMLRGMLSFNLTGPFSLALCAGFFSRLILAPAQVIRLFMVLLGPLVAIGAIVVFNIVTAEKLEFSFESNAQMAGGFGPNQVSLALGLGAFASFWCLLERGMRWPVRTVLFATMLWLGAQCALTFSRGGMLGAATSAAVALLFLALDKEARKKMVLVVPLLVALAYFVVWPALVDFTGGNLAVRYSESGLSRRDELGKRDIDIWLDNPVLGVGPGISARYHETGLATHTEFTRAFAEHGTFGALFVALMVGIGAVCVIRAPSPREKALVAAAFTWCALYMLNSAMRTVAPSFMYGLSCCLLLPSLNQGLREAAIVVSSVPRRLIVSLPLGRRCLVSIPRPPRTIVGAAPAAPVPPRRVLVARHQSSPA